MKENTSTYYNIIGGGIIKNGNVIDIGNNYTVPKKSLFIDGFEYERTDGKDWFKKVYDEFQKNDIELLINQNRIRIVNNGETR